MTLDDGAVAGIIVAATALGALLLKAVQWAGAAVFSARKSDVAFGRELRDELWKEVGRLRTEVESMRGRADECDQRALDCQEENLRLAERVSQLETARA